MGKGLPLNGAYATAAIPLLFLMVPPIQRYRASGLRLPAARLRIQPTKRPGRRCFGLNTIICSAVAHPLAHPINSPRGSWSSTDTFSVKDVAAIVVAIAVIEPKSRALLTTANVEKLAGTNGQTSPLIDYGGAFACPGLIPPPDWQKPGELQRQWQCALDLNTIGLPRPAISGIRLYERYFYLSQ